jgi:nucleoside-diphosphate-sugar epimerase
LISEAIVNSFFETHGKLSVIVTGCITRHLENSRQSFEKNIEYLNRFLDKLSRINVSSIFYLSSIDVYGQEIKALPITEETQIQIEDFYSLAKFSSEFLITKFCNERRIPYLLARLTGVFGPGDDKRCVASKIIDAAVTHKLVEITDCGEIYRDFLYIGDLCQIILEFLKKPKKIGVLNIGSGQTISLGDLAKYLGSMVGSSTKLVDNINGTHSAARAKVIEVSQAKFRTCFPNFTHQEWRISVNNCIF